MFMLRALYMSAVLLLLAASAVSAQAPTAAREHQDQTTITLLTESDRVRFSTPGKALEWRLDVGSAQGEPVFDSGLVTGSALEWPLLDAQGQAIESGLYRYTLTIRTDASNARVQRGHLQIERMQSVYRIAATSENGPSGGGLLNVIDASDASDPSRPELAAAAMRTAGGSSLADEPAPIGRNLRGVSFGALISGTGTTSSMTKWIDGPGGVVGDTNVTEVNGSVVIGNGTFHGNLHVFGSTSEDLFAGMGPNVVAGPAFNFGYAGQTFGRSAGFFNVRPDVFASAPNPSLRFMTANVERMIVTNLGRVGIGTSTPVGELEVIGGASAISVTTFAISSQPTISGRRALGTAASPGTVESGDILLLLAGRGYAPSGFSAIRAGVALHASEDWTDTAQGTFIRFQTSMNGTGGLTERMRIHNDGSVGIGTTATLAEKLHVIGDIRVGTSGTAGCVQRFDGAAIAGACSSDLRFKRDVTPFPNLLDKVTQLRPVHYYWRSREFPERQFGTAQVYGLVAQEVEQVFPELVTADERGDRRVDYGKLPLLTLQAIKELKAENDTLKQRLQQQDERLRALERGAKAPEVK